MNQIEAWKRIEQHSNIFKDEKNFNIIKLLFLNVWQNDLEKTDPNDYKIKEKNAKREVEVLKCLLRCVQHTRRFKKKRYGIQHKIRKRIQ